MLKLLVALIKNSFIPVNKISTKTVVTKYQNIVTRVERLSIVEINPLYMSCYVITLPYTNLTTFTDKLKQHIYNKQRPYNTDHFIIPNVNKSIMLKEFIEWVEGSSELPVFYKVVKAYMELLDVCVKDNVTFNNVDEVMYGHIDEFLSSLEDISF